MRFCLVGCGTIAEAHMEALCAIEGVHPRVLVGRRAGPTAEFAARWGFDRHTLDMYDAFDDPEVDAVVITSPSEMHAEQAMRALARRKHVLVEIPISLNLPDAERVTRLARDVDRRLMVAHTMRSLRGVQEVYRRARAGRLKVHHIVGFQGQLRRTNVSFTGKPRSWTDNLLWHHAAHMVDAALWVSGHKDAGNVFCQFGPRHPTQGILDLSLCMRLPGGELFTLAQSYNITQHRWRLTFIGEEGTLDFDTGMLRDADGTVIVPHQSVTDLSEQDREFVEAVRQGRDPAITGEDVLPTMRILQLAQECAEASSCAAVYHESAKGGNHEGDC